MTGSYRKFQNVYLSLALPGSINIGVDGNRGVDGICSTGYSAEHLRKEQ